MRLLKITSPYNSVILDNRPISLLEFTLFSLSNEVLEGLEQTDNRLADKMSSS